MSDTFQTVRIRARREQRLTMAVPGACGYSSRARQTGGGMRRLAIWGLALIALYLAAEAAASAYTLTDFSSRPVTALVKNGAEIPLWLPDLTGEPAKEGEGRHAGGEGIPLGYRHDFLLPSGEAVSCTHILRWMWCEGGWSAVREADPVGQAI